MNNFFTEDTKAIILLCGVFGKDRSEKPLSLAEYSSLVRWLIGVKCALVIYCKKKCYRGIYGVGH
jgi:hypothetical protein